MPGCSKFVYIILIINFAELKSQLEYSIQSIRTYNF